MQRLLALSVAGLLVGSCTLSRFDTERQPPASGGAPGASGSESGGTGGGVAGATTGGEAGAAMGGVGGTTMGGEAGAATGGEAGATTGGVGGTTTGGVGGTTTGGSGGAGGVVGCGNTAPSCLGRLDCNGESCCASLPVTGDTYDRGADPVYPATVGDFCMDKYEITVGRFRKFVADYDRWTSAAGGSHPTPGEGEHRLGDGSGWQEAFTLPADAAALTGTNGVQCDAIFPTWRDTQGTAADENLPINCLTWYEAFAFCIWDGGRLATEAEWEYAAGHGSENRTYPWGPATPTLSLVVFDCEYGGTPGTCAYSDIAPVGSRTAGNGFWGQSDLAGGVWEWVLDTYASPYAIAPCDDCADTQHGPERVVRGGGFENGSMYLTAAGRLYLSPQGRQYDIGVRCVRPTG